MDRNEIISLINANLNRNLKPLHPGQARFVKKALPKELGGEGCKRIFLRNGRKWAKTTSAVYLANACALRMPKWGIYIFAPLQKQAREIYWEEMNDYGRVLPDFLNIDNERSPFVAKVKDNECRMEFYNGSFIKIDGSDNFAAARGYNPHLVIADEIAQFDPRWFNAMLPNLRSHSAPLVLLGTPPENPILEDGSKHHFVKFAEEFEAEMARGMPVFTMEAPSTENVYVYGSEEGKKELAEEKKRLFARGESDVYYREYEGRIIYSGATYIFPAPVFVESENVLPHQVLLDRIGQDQFKYDWYCVADPGTKECFAVGFFAIDNYKGEILKLAEIHATDQADNSSGRIWETIQPILQELFPYPQDWNYVYDEAAAWFPNELNNHHENLGWIPTNKHQMRTETGELKPYISSLKDLLQARRYLISDRCTATVKEYKSYQKDSKGRIPKGNDHQIDLDRYLVASSGFSLNSLKTDSILLNLNNRRYDLIESDMVGEVEGLPPDLFDGDDESWL